MLTPVYLRTSPGSYVGWTRATWYTPKIEPGLRGRTACVHRHRARMSKEEAETFARAWLAKRRDLVEVANYDDAMAHIAAQEKAQ